MLFFSPSSILQEFFCVDGVEKVGIIADIPLLLLATLAAVLFHSNRGLIRAFVRFNSMHSWPLQRRLKHMLSLCELFYSPDVLV